LGRQKRPPHKNRSWIDVDAMVHDQHATQDGTLPIINGMHKSGMQFEIISKVIASTRSMVRIGVRIGHPVGKSMPVQKERHPESGETRDRYHPEHWPHHVERAGLGSML
jgi:hypothetical protein